MARHDPNTSDMIAQCAPIQPADAVADSVVALEKDRWLKGLVKKTKHPKVRSGCLTCKQRRLKCDEAKPHCQRCLKSKRQCDGYGYPPRSSPVRELIPGAETWNITAQDDELLHEFIGEAVEHLSGFSASMKLFCRSLAPQLGHSYPAVRNALLSCAARTRAATFRWDGRWPRTEATAFKAKALVYYNVAIQQLTTTSDREIPAEVFLVCGLLFAAIEFWPHRYMAPEVHILTAFKLILRGTAMLPEAVKEGMFPFLVHMGRKAVAFSDDLPSELASQIRNFCWINVRPSPVPTAFVSLKEAWSYMDALLNHIAAFDPEDPTFTTAGHMHARQFAAEIQRAVLQTIELLTDNVDDEDQNHRFKTQYRALLMHHRALQIMLDTNQTTDELIYDGFTADFSHILSECESLLHEAQDPDVSAKKAPWHTTLGLLSPLFFVATRCRIPSLRHRAIKALHASRRREREWNSCIATMLARLVVHTEEKSREPGQVGTIPKEQRIRLDRVVFDREGEQMHVSYVNPATGEVGTSVLSWHLRGGVDDEFECIKLSRRSLRLSGYAGAMLVTPPIACQCGGDDAMIRRVESRSDLKL